MGNATSPSSAIFSWLPLSPEDQNGLIIQYSVNITHAESGVTFIVVTSSSHTSIEYVTLKPFTTYLCSVAAATSIGLGPYTSEISITMPEAGELIASGKQQNM